MTNNNNKNTPSTSYPFFAVLDELLARGILPAKLTVGQVTAEFLPTPESKPPISTHIDSQDEILDYEDENISAAKKQEAFEKSMFYSA